MDTGWLLVGVAGVCGGLALALVGAGVATSPLLLPVGALFALCGYLAWVVGSSRVVATVYEEVGEPGRTAAADERTGRRRDRQDPDGNWGTAADGGRTAAGGPTDDGADAGPGFEHGPGAAAGSAVGEGETGEDPVDGVWDAHERDRVGGWDDWEWADRRWREFEREYDIGSGGDAGTDARTGTDTGTSPDDGPRGRRDGRGGGRHGSRSGGADRTGGDGRRGGAGGDGRRERGHREGADGAGGRDGSRRRDRRSRRSGASGTPGGRRPDRRAVRARKVLGVDRDADAEEVRAAYRDRVKETHPDRGGDPEAFKRVQWAYDYLAED